MPNMTGRPGHRTMEMNGGSSASYLARTLESPCFVLRLVGVETERFLDYQGRAGIISIVRWNLRPVIFQALPNGGEWNGGYATFVWQERAQTRATQMTHAPSLKPLCLLCQNQGSFRHRRVICLSHRKKRTPHLKGPPFKSARIFGVEANCLPKTAFSFPILFFSTLGTLRGATGTLPPGPTPPAPTQLKPSART